MFGTYFVRNLTQLCPRSFVLPALIMLGGKAQTVIQIRIVENDMAMQVVFIIVDGDNILIIALEITVELVVWRDEPFFSLYQHFSFMFQN